MIGAHQLVRARAALEARGGVGHQRNPGDERVRHGGATEGVDVVFDPVGGDATEAALRSTRWNGRLLVVGFASGEIPKIPLNLTLLKGNSLVGVFWGRFTAEEPERSLANRRQLLQWAADGTIVTADGSRSAHFEHTVAITENGPRILTNGVR